MPGHDDGYDWLYGGRRPPGSAPDDADATRVIPSAGGTGRMSPPGHGLPPPTRIARTPGSAPPGRSPGAGRSGASGRPRFRLRWLLYLLVAWVVYLVAVPVYAWTTVSMVDADPGGDRPADQPGTTYLVVGSDARKGLAGRRTDTIMLLHTGHGPNLLLSVPRDSLVEVPGHGTTKINAAFAYGGPKLLIQTIENDTGIRVDHYVETGFGGLQELVDAVGGITICPKTAMKDPLAHLDIPKGCQQADGRTALGYARSRHTQRLGDIGREQDQREVVSAIGHAIVSWKTVVDPVRYWRVMTSGADAVRVGKGTTPVNAAMFASAMTRVNGKSGLTCGVPISDLAVHWDPERSRQLFGLIANDETDKVGRDLCTPSGLRQP